MSTRFPWDSHEVALLINAYLKVTSGDDLNQVAVHLSQTLRELAVRNGIQIDDTYRNINGMKMQLANVQYLFTKGEKGLSGASVLIRKMVELYQANPEAYQIILKEAIHMTGATSTSVEDAFFAYAKDKVGIPPKMLADYLKKAADYCQLKEPLLGTTDVKVVRNIQRKVSEGKLLRFRFGKDAQTIRNVTQLYYNFVKSYRKSKEETTFNSAPVQEAPPENPVVPETSEVAPNVAPAISLEEFAASVEQVQENERSEEVAISEKVVPADSIVAQLTVDFSRDNSYPFTKPVTYTYKGQNHPAKSWNRSYVEICGLLFADHRDAFMSIMNGDIPGYNALAFADEQNYSRMRVPKSFAPGFYLESNLDATSIVQKLRGLHQLFAVGDDLQIVYQMVDGCQPSRPKERREVGAQGQLVVDENYDWCRSGLLLVDLTKETSYAFTQPDAYEYKGVTRRVNRWGKLYADLCGLLFEDYHDAFMSIMNGDVPGYNSLAFADEQHKGGMRAAKQFTPGYYLELNMNATTIARRIRGLYQLFNLGDGLRISYMKTGDTRPAIIPEESGEECPIQGEAIDTAMKAVGSVRDERVFIRSEEDNQLISSICEEINDILSRYTTVYRSCIYERYHEQLASISIYTEPVMTQQLLAKANGSFILVNQAFAKPGQCASVIQDERKVLRDHGGSMTVDDVAKVLWFVPRDMVYHHLSVDGESLNIGNSTWMLAEHFPVTQEDADKIGNMLDEVFLTSNYVQASDLPSLLQSRLPGIADNLSGMTYMAVFNIAQYYLRDRFNFTKAIISPKGISIDFTDLFRAFAAERDNFTLADLEAMASELNLPIYWESTYAGGAVRVSKTEFVNRRLIQFDVEAIDAVLADFCPDDYLPLMSVSSAMMMHLPSCGYRWNGYLLQSYVHGFSKVFRLSYSSFGKNGFYGAMVRKSCKMINSYSSLIEQVLTDDGTWETPADALDILVKRGYQALRKYKEIDNVVAQARKNKLAVDGR